MREVRTLFFAVLAEAGGSPHDVLQLRVSYPGKRTGDEREQRFGVVQADTSGAPYPVVILLPGTNCEPARYGWLLSDLARRGAIAVSASWVRETLPGLVELTPGIDLTYCRPETYGRGPTASAVAPILRALTAAHHGDGVLAGMVDLGSVVLGGHSAGGCVALHSADRRYFSGVRAVFTYGAHTLASAALGFAPGIPLPMGDDLPLLMLGGSEDGVLAQGAPQHGLASEPDLPIRLTFAQACRGGRDDCYLAILRGANHETILYPSDPTVGRTWLDFPARADQSALRTVIAGLIGDFMDAHVRGDTAARRALGHSLEGPWIERFERK